MTARARESALSWASRLAQSLEAFVTADLSEQVWRIAFGSANDRLREIAQLVSADQKRRSPVAPQEEEEVLTAARLRGGAGALRPPGAGSTGGASAPASAARRGTSLLRRWMCPDALRPVGADSSRPVGGTDSIGRCCLRRLRCCRSRIAVGEAALASKAAASLDPCEEL